MGKSSNRLRDRLKRSESIKDNNKAVKEVFGAFGEYYGSKADESRKKANMYLGTALFLFALILISALSSL